MVSRMPPKILVYRIGSLGDNLVALPAIHAVRRQFPNSPIYHLGSIFPSSGRVVGAEVFENSGLFKGYFVYPSPTGFTRFQKIFSFFHFFKLWIFLKLEKFDILVYLAPSNRSGRQLRRDKFFFSSAGIKKIIGMDGFEEKSSLASVEKTREMPREAKALVRRLRISGLTVSDEESVEMSLGLTNAERDEFEKILRKDPRMKGGVWIGVGPGSNQPVKIWPRERFSETIKRLIDDYDAWPLIIGGNEDKELGDWLIEQWGMGSNFAGKLSVRMSAVALGKCRLYLGNDTGPMHLAAAVGTRCVAIFSSHASPGKWYPHGPGHKVFRTSIDCEGCGLSVCIDKKMEIGRAHV